MKLTHWRDDLWAWTAVCDPWPQRRWMTQPLCRCHHCVQVHIWTNTEIWSEGPHIHRHGVSSKSPRPSLTGQTHQCPVTCQGQSLGWKPCPQTWDSHSWAGKPHNNISLVDTTLWMFLFVCLSVYWRQWGRSLRTPRGMGGRGRAWLWGEGFLGKDRWKGRLGDVSSLHLVTYMQTKTREKIN